MPVKKDFRALFKILFEEKVEYLVIGAHAVSFYTQPRKMPHVFGGHSKDSVLLLRE